MNRDDKVPEVVVYDLLASSGFALSGEDGPDDQTEYWIHNDRDILLPVPFPRDGHFPRPVLLELQRIIATYGL